MSLLQAQQAYNAQAEKVKRLSEEGAHPDPNQERKRLAVLQKEEHERIRLLNLTFEMQNASGAQTRGRHQAGIEAILNNDEAALSQMSAEQYVQLRDRFLKTAPKIQAGEDVQAYSERVREWISTYNASGDLVDNWTKRVVAEHQRQVAARSQREQQTQADRSRRMQQEAERRRAMESRRR